MLSDLNGVENEWCVLFSVDHCFEKKFRTQILRSINAMIQDATLLTFEHKVRLIQRSKPQKLITKCVSGIVNSLPICRCPMLP